MEGRERGVRLSFRRSSGSNTYEASERVLAFVER